MLTFLGLVVFATMALIVAGVFVFTLMPALPRIAAVLGGREDPVLAGQHRLVVSDRRRRSMRSSASVVTGPVASWRVAA